eukprot:TRINITY_DN552_c0_g4_i1.p1 TRINITY_DN552_c0_g4~~TRINITY_DN552_c0_g4_i1.p1  ORF type:complete len:443 (+),score=53.04 TRINITY_DN552_c0_g4_i1:65-1393(+)
MKAQTQSKYILIAVPLIGLLMMAGVFYKRGERGGVKRKADDKRLDEAEREIRRLKAEIYVTKLEKEELQKNNNNNNDAKTTPDTLRVDGADLHPGVLPSGNDLGNGDPRFLTVPEAIRVCKVTAGCKGFTLAGSDSNPKKRVRIFFKSVFKLSPDVKGWWSYKVHDTIPEPPPIDPGFSVFKKFAHMVEADYNVTEVAVKGGDAFLNLWPEYETPGTAKIRYLEPSSEWATLAVSPRVVFIPDTVSEKDAEDIVARSNSQLQRSLVANDEKHTNESGVKNVRTSSGAWLGDDFEPAKRLRDKLEKMTGVSRKNFEMLQILRYQPGQKYGSHVDYFHPAAYGKKNWNRMATVITFLTTVKSGGESNFPLAHSFVKSHSDCTRGLRVHPVIGHSVLFYSMRPDLNFDHYSLHGGCPVGEGEEKWVAVQWLRVELPDGLPPESLA